MTMRVDLMDAFKSVWNTVCRRENRNRVAMVLIVLLTVSLVVSGVRKIKEVRHEKAIAAQAAVEEVVEEPVEESEPEIPQQYIDEAEAIARVLYGIRDNSLRDQRTYIWCLFNRVDNPSREFANTLEEVIGKPSQWMFYDPSNPVLESQYQLALTEVIIWHEGHRPVSCDWVFAVWSSNKIYLTKEIGGAEQWQYPES